MNRALLTTGWDARRTGGWRRFATAFGLACACVGVGEPAGAAAPGSEARAGAPATLAEARKTLDLAAFPLAAQAERPSQRNLAGLVYSTRGEVKGIFDAQRTQLIDRKWTERPGSSVSDQAASGTFTRDGFTVSLTAFPSGQPGLVLVSLLNHGNVALDKLPTPPGVKPFYGGPVSLAYLTEAPVAETAEACRKQLLKSGWESYGDAGDVAYYKRNAVRLAVRTAVAPAQGGKTVLEYSTQLMSADLPAPAGAERLQYADTDAQLRFVTKATGAEVADFYRQALAGAGWEPTTKNVNKIGFNDVLIFRNPEKDLLTLELAKAAGKSRVLLKQQSAAEVEAQEKRLDAAIAKRESERNKPLPKLAVTVPRDASGVKLTKSSLDFNVGSQRAKPVVEAWRAQFRKDGWKESAITLDPMAGSTSFTKGGQSLTVIYSDVGFIPAEVSIRAVGVELERAAQGK